MWDLHSSSKAWQGCCPQTHGKPGSPPPQGALPPPHPHSPFVRGAEGKHSQPLWVCAAALEPHFLFHDSYSVRQGIEGPLSRKLPTWTSMHSHEALFLFSSLGEQSSLPASSIRTYRTSQKRNMGLKNEKNKKRKRERERKPSFLLIQVRRLGLGFSHSPSQNEDRTSAASAARGAEDTARYRSWNNSNNNGQIY